jgi:glycerol-3-phosphate dehydrogenase
MGKTVLGTTDTPCSEALSEPMPFREEIDFILGEAGRHLEHAPSRTDVRSVWVGLRPLVKPAGEDDTHTKSISREHAVRIGRSGLVTVTGGKWTTYRAMAEDVLDRCIEAELLPRQAASGTSDLPLVGAPAHARARLTQAPGAHLYGTEAALLQTLPGATRWLWRQDSGGLSEAMVRFAARHEMARTVEDVLARRCRLLFLDAAQASAVAGEVALLLREELGTGFDADSSAASFKALATQYMRVPQ